MAFTFEKKIDNIIVHDTTPQTNVLPERSQIIIQMNELNEISKELQYEPKNANVRKGQVMARIYKKLLQKELEKKKGFSFGA